jgi:5'-AMP-activated protein kinase regulatory gamma subunit
MHSVAAWKEAKLQYYGGPDVAAMQRRPLVHVFSIFQILLIILLAKQSNISFS